MAAETTPGKQSAMEERQVGRRVLREQIKDHLIQLILSGQLKPGDRIVETKLAQELGVSQTPVREALRDLELLGFVVSAPFRGTQVREFSREELVEIYPIRAAIEGVAARAAATRLTNEHVLALEEQIDRMREAVEAGDCDNIVKADIAFHRIVVEASGNQLVQQFWTSLSLATSTFLTISIAQRPLADLPSRHERVLEALRSGDPDYAEQVMRLHVEEPGRWVYETVQQELAAQATDGTAEADGTEETQPEEVAAGQRASSNSEETSAALEGEQRSR